jgi:hypothetical protein
MEPIRRDEWPSIVAGGVFLLLFGIWGILLTLAAWGMARLGRRFADRVRPFYGHQDPFRSAP